MSSPDRSIGEYTYIVIVTRGHRHDGRALAAVVGSNARYIGLIGSKRKIVTIFEQLHREGVPREQLAKVHAPIGLDIGAVTPRRDRREHRRRTDCRSSRRSRSAGGSYEVNGSAARTRIVSLSLGERVGVRAHDPSKRTTRLQHALTLSLSW